MAAVSYLQRNDFTQICVENNSLIRARDGKQVVFIIVSGEALSDVIVKQHLLARGRSIKARFDIIHIDDDGDGSGTLKHFINAVKG
jgi:hypothetical protein